MAEDFAGKVALVTGAAGGIGAATAKALAAAGAKVVVADVSAKAGEQVVSEIKAAGGTASFITCDVSDPAAVKAMVDHAVSTYGGLDLAVNNAGIDPEFAPEARWDLGDFEKIMGVNIRGVFVGMKYEIEQMLKRGGGAIVNVASFAGLNGVPNKPAYTASKHAVIGMTKASSLQYARQGIRINAVCPGGVRTAIMTDNLPADFDMTIVNDNHPIGRISDPEEIAGAILFLLSDKAGFVIGHGLVIDGGLGAG